MGQTGPEQGGGAGLWAGLANPGDGAAGLWDVAVESPAWQQGAQRGIHALAFEFCAHLGVPPLVPPRMC